jgi:hypothetical protein
LNSSLLLSSSEFRTFSFFATSTPTNYLQPTIGELIHGFALWILLENSYSTLTRNRRKQTQQILSKISTGLTARIPFLRPTIFHFEQPNGWCVECADLIATSHGLYRTWFNFVDRHNFHLYQVPRGHVVKYWSYPDDSLEVVSLLCKPDHNISLPINKQVFFFSVGFHFFGAGCRSVHFYFPFDIESVVCFIFLKEKENAFTY